MTTRDAEDAIHRLEGDDFDLVILDICLPRMSGLDALARIKLLRPVLPVIVMTGRGTTDTAIEATKRGAFEYQLKPFEPLEMLQSIDKALAGARLMKGRVELGPEAMEPSIEAIVGRSAVMQQVYKAIGRVAQTDATVLICGETGTGKELVARAIYQHSLRSHLPMTVVNCAALPETLLESELFGSERAPLRARLRGESESLNRPTTAPCFSTKSAICPWRLRPRYCGCSKSKALSGSAAMRRFKWTFVFCVPRTATWRTRSRMGPFARISIIV